MIYQFTLVMSSIVMTSLGNISSRATNTQAARWQVHKHHRWQKWPPSIQISAVERNLKARRHWFVLLVCMSREKHLCSTYLSRYTLAIFGAKSRQGVSKNIENRCFGGHFGKETAKTLSKSPVRNFHDSSPICTKQVWRAFRLRSLGLLWTAGLRIRQRWCCKPLRNL